jgi:3-oxoacyl-[acyl-carrier-protein] synthase-3
MTETPMRHATISGSGLHVPARLVPNSEFNARYGIDVDSFLVENRNIRQRYYMADDEATSDLVVPAAREALAAAGITAEDLDLVIIATDTPDYVSPSTAAVVQYKLGARNAGVFDVNTACSGFVTALDMAGKYIAADAHYRHILVAGAYGMSKYLDFDDHKIATLFADGAGAVVVSASEQPGILASTLYADGQYHDYMGIYAGGTHMPITADVLGRKDHLLRFAKKIPIETNATHWPRLVRTLLEKTGRTIDQVDRFFFTQININSINETLDTLGVAHDRAHNVMDRYAYTGSACIPMALADAARQHLLAPGDFVMLVGSGGGMSMAAVALDWTTTT